MLSFEESNNFFLRSGLLFKSSIESSLGRLDRETASFDELLCKRSDMGLLCRSDRLTLLLDLSPESFDA